MGRVWVDFVNAADLPRSSISLGSERFTARSLAEGATSSHGRFAQVDGPGWSRIVELATGEEISAHSVGAHVRGYLVNGSVEIEGSLHRHGLFFEVLPGGLFPHLKAASGSSLFLSVEGEYVPSKTQSVSESRFQISHFDTSVWKAPVVSDLPSGAARRALGDHGDFGAGVLGVLPGWDSPYEEWHTFSEEILILTGVLLTSFGIMKPGSYLSHPSGDDTVHGPVYSPEGATMLVLRHGPIGNTYTPAITSEIARVRALHP